MNGAVVYAQRVSRSFGGVTAVQDVTLNVQPGERRVIIGPNGAGKTTLFHLIAGQLRPTQGRVYLFGTDVTHLAPDQRARMGLARTFQITNLFPKMTVRDNVLLATLAHSWRRFAFWEPLSRLKGPLRQAEALLEAWSMSRWADLRASELPYGEQRRLEIVLALAQRPRLLLLDEPTAGLSAAEAATSATTIRALPREVALVIIEHDMDIAFSLADTVTVMHEGRILAEGSVDEVRSNQQVKEIYLGTGAYHAP